MKGYPDSDLPGLIVNRACRNCIQIKVKCVPFEGLSGTTCQRCHRLKKLCTTPAPIARKPRNKSSRVTRLEERIDHLAGLLTPVQAREETLPVALVPVNESTSTQIITPETPSTQSSAQSGVEALSCDLDELDGFSGSWGPGTQPIARSGSPAMFYPHLPGRRDGSQLTKETFCPIYIEPGFENRLFEDFRRRMVDYFPFVLIDESIPAQVFKEQKPFTYWSAIAAASYRDPLLSLKLNEEMFKAIGHRMLVSGSKNIDLLQGLLLMLAWHHYVSHQNAQGMNLLHLARAVLADMGAARPVRVQDKIRIASDFAAMMSGIATASIKITQEERRALLACFCITSKTSFTFNRLDSMQYSQHIDDCCKHLKNTMEYKSDLLLVQLVQLHRVFGKYLQAEHETATSSRAYRTMFQEEIQRFKDGLPVELQDDHILSLEIISGSLRVLEPSYEPEKQDNLDRLDALHVCASLGDQYIQNLTAISIDELPYLSFLTTTGHLVVLVVLARLSFFRSDGWDTAYARKITNYRNILQQMQDQYEDCHRNEATRYPDSPAWRFARYAEKTGHVKAWYDAKVAAEEAAVATNVERQVQNDFTDTLFGEFDDDRIWQDLMKTWMQD